MNHLVDIFDCNYKHIGVDSKENAHKKGLWHRVFTCMVCNPKNKTVILQKKTPDRYDFYRPDYVDITVGGHYIAGENIDKGIREIKEEIGIDIEFKKLVPLGIRQTAAKISENYIANEFQHIFLLPLENDLEKYNVMNNEVCGLIEVNIDKGILLLTNKINLVTAKGIFNVNGNVIEKNIELTREDFVPAYLEIDQFMLRLFIAAKKYLDNDNNENLFW